MNKTELVFSSTFYEFTFKSIPKPNCLPNTNKKVFKKNLKNFLITMLYKGRDFKILRKRDDSKTLLKYFLLKIYLYLKNERLLKLN